MTYMIPFSADGLPPQGIIKLPERKNIPNNDSNKDWAEYQEWLTSGNTPLEWDETTYLTYTE